LIIHESARELDSFGEQTTAEIASEPIAADHVFHSVIVSVNPGLPITDVGLTADVMCSLDGMSWTPWFRMLQWKRGDDSEGVLRDASGQVHVDTLKLTHLAGLIRYRVRWQSDQHEHRLRRVALSLSDDTYPDEEPPPNRSAWGRKMDVPFISQWSVTEHEADRVCSPTSLAMMAAFYDRPITPGQAATAAYDPGHDIYGNWSVNMLAASTWGLAAYVDRAVSLRYLEDRVAAGHPTIVSIAFNSHGLPGAPMMATGGHLIVVAGFSETGDPIVRDPAADGDDVWMTYPRDAFALAWLGHGGVVYCIQPESV
jgi:hypothetical protein